MTQVSGLAAAEESKWGSRHAEQGAEAAKGPEQGQGKCDAKVK